jgi:hypothetical protein
MQDSACETPRSFQQLISEAAYALVLLADSSSGEWQLIEPKDVAETDARRSYSERGLHFAGVVCLTDGNPRVKLAVPMGLETVAEIAREFVRRWARSITHPRWCCVSAPGVN